MRYDYECDSCGAEVYDIEQTVSDTPLTKCPKCGEKSLYRVLLAAPSASVQSDAVTIGQLAERNAKKLGREEVQERTLKDKDSKKEALKQARKEMHSKINKMSEAQQKKYILDG